MRLKKGEQHVLAPNILKRQFVATVPNQWWVSDITYIKTGEGWLFLTTVLDLFSRKVVGWDMSHRITEDVVIRALNMAYFRRKPTNSVYVHSDQGSQYTSKACQKALGEMQLIPSMSRKGNCWDNAVAESFFANLKKELIGKKVYKTRQDAKQSIFGYIEMFYNPIRRHTFNNRVAPNVLEEQYFAKLKTVY